MKMVDVKLSKAFNDFNHTKFFILVCLLAFTILIALRLDNTITLSYWIIFIPLWIWKLTATLGFFSGAVCWQRLGSQRLTGEYLTQFKEINLTYISNVLLFAFEMLMCTNLERYATNRNEAFLWILCFVPLIVLSLTSLINCIWSLKNSKSFEMDLLLFLNLLLFIFTALKFDNIIQWSWEVVFIPLWINMFLFLIVLFYLFIVTILISSRYSNSANAEMTTSNTSIKLTSWLDTISLILAYFLLILFEIFITVKLDHLDNHQFHLSFVQISSPLFVAFLLFIFLTFNSRSGNFWWFGIQRDFCQVILTVCPCLKIYGNIEFSLNKEALNGASESLLNSNDVIINQSQLNQIKKKKNFFSKLMHQKEEKPQQQQKQTDNVFSVEMPD